jgi:hypothetical protein
MTREARHNGLRATGARCRAVGGAVRFTIRRTVPDGTEAISNGALVNRSGGVGRLRNRIGTRAFFCVWCTWVHGNSDGLGSSAEYKRLAERMSGQQLDGFYRAWLSSTKPAATKANGL